MDRYVLAGALLAGAAFALRALNGAHLIAFLAGAAGLVMLHERLRQEFSSPASALTSVLIFAGTSLFWSMTHASSPGDAIAFALVAGGVLVAARVTSTAARTTAWAVVSAILVATAAGSGAYELQGALSRATESLFSSTRGFLSLTPIVYLAVIGTAIYLRRDRAMALGSLLALASCLFAAAVRPREKPDAFGNGLTPALALVAPGLALVIDYVRSRPLVAAAPLVIAAALWNYWLMVQYTAGSLPKDEPVSFAAMVRQQADVHTRPPYLYPFAFPANVYFAWREGVPIDRYEVLSQVPRGHSWDAMMDHSVDRFLLDGWGGAGSTLSGPVRWTAGRRATLAFPLTPALLGTTVQLVTSARVEEPAVNTELAVEMNGIEIGRFVATPTPAETTLTLPATSVGRVLRAGYNRLTIVNHGIHRANPADQRPLGPLATRSGDVPFPVAIHRIRISAS